MADKQRKTVPIGEVKDPWTCKLHGLTVVKRIRRHVSRHGADDDTSIYYGCPSYHECGYYISGNMKAVSATNEQGVALGRLEEDE